MDKFFEKLGGEQTPQGAEKKFSFSGINKRSLAVRTALVLALQTNGCGVLLRADEIPDDPPVEAGTDAGADAQKDNGTDIGKDTANDVHDGGDAGPQAKFMNVPGENDCVKWLTSDAGVTQSFSSDNKVCEPKPVKAPLVNKGEFLYVWSKDGANNTVHFAAPTAPTKLSTKCSAYQDAPDSAEMRTDLLSGSYMDITNASTAPDVKLNNSCAGKSASYIISFE